MNLFRTTAGFVSLEGTEGDTSRLGTRLGNFTQWFLVKEYLVVIDYSLVNLFMCHPLPRPGIHNRISAVWST